MNATHDAGANAIPGEEAVRTLSYVMPEINYFGATNARVQDALVLISESGGSEGFLESAARPASAARKDPSALVVGSYSPPVRVALEIASQEQQERRALEDELSILWNEWKEAEEIAGIVDTLFSQSPKV